MEKWILKITSSWQSRHNLKLLNIMITGRKIPFVYENMQMNKALKILSEKKLGMLVVRNKNNLTTGI